MILSSPIAAVGCFSSVQEPSVLAGPPHLSPTAEREATYEALEQQQQWPCSWQTCLNQLLSGRKATVWLTVWLPDSSFDSRCVPPHRIWGSFNIFVMEKINSVLNVSVYQIPFHTMSCTAKTNDSENEPILVSTGACCCHTRKRGSVSCHYIKVSSFYMIIFTFLHETIMVFCESFTFWLDNLYVFTWNIHAKRENEQKCLCLVLFGFDSITK